MILTKEEDLEELRRAGRLAGEVLEELIKIVTPGISTFELDRFAEQIIRDAGALPTFKGYRNYPCSLCTSVNEEVVHGIPSRNKLLKEGDIISMDLGVTLRRLGEGKKFDFIGDTAVTVAVGKVSARLEKLMKDTQYALYQGIRACRKEASLDDVGGAIEDVAKANAYGLVRDYGGHGIGPSYHEDPFIFNYRTGSKKKLQAGMVIAIEPMFNQGGDRVKTKPDGWTVVTQDYKPSAHFEHSLIVTEGEPEILTRRPSEVIG